MARECPSVEQRREVRAVPVIRYPYRIFYVVTDDEVQILHIHHSAREPWAE
jgi:plasmid stabilization system protein ParE